MKSKLLRAIATMSLLLTIFLLGVPPSTFAGTCTAPTGAIGWASATWTGTCSATYSGHPIPGNGDDVIIPAGSTITLGINSTTSPASPTLNSVSITGVLSMGNATNGNWGELIASGNVVINSGGTLDTTNATGALTNYVRYGGSFINNGTFNATSTGGDDHTIVTQLVTPTATPIPTADNRPNIVFILTDDQANYDPTNMPDDMPNLKSLIIPNGLTFNKYFVSIPLCCPSRATTYAGRYAHNTEIYDLGAVSGGFAKFYQLGEENSTIATWLQAAGYRTALFGKYLNGYPNKGQETYIPPGWNEWASPSSDAAYTQFNYKLNENGTLVSYGGSSNPANYMGDVLSGKATDFISRAADLGQPFFVNITTYSPHVASATSHAVPAPRDAGLWSSGLSAPRTPNWNEADISDKPTWLRSMPLLTSGSINEIDSWYTWRVRSLQSVDDMILSIVNMLKTKGKYNNTYIFITSDNGYHMGNHRMVEGKESPYEEDVRVPMWVIGPGVPAGQTRDHLAINTDLAATFAELGGVTPPANVDGHSLVPLLGSNPPSISSWRSAVLLEHGVTGPSGPVIMGQVSDPLLLEPEENWWVTPGLRAPQNEVAAPSGIYSGVRTNNFKYIEYTNGDRELYDLRSDPYELQNIASVASPTLLSSLSSLVATLHTCSGANCWVTNQPTAVTLSSFTAHADDSADNLLVMGLVIGIGSIAFAGVWLRRRR